jgi:hypothetical protein
MKSLNALRTEVAVAARRVDSALIHAAVESRRLKGAGRVVPATLLLGAALVAGFLLVVVPKKLRIAALLALGQFAAAKVFGNAEHGPS